MIPISSIVGDFATLPPLAHLRDIEAFDGPILSERRAPDGSLYIEKWCDTDHRGGWRTLVVPVERTTVVEYVMQRITLLALLQSNADVGYLVDYQGSDRIRVRRVRVSRLPSNYLPTPTAKHDPSLSGGGPEM